MKRNDFGMPSIVRNGLKINCQYCGHYQAVSSSVRAAVCEHCKQMLVFLPRQEMEKILKEATPTVSAKRYNQLRKTWVETNEKAGDPNRQDFLDLFRLLESQTAVIEKNQQELDALRGVKPGDPL